MREKIKSASRQSRRAKVLEAKSISATNRTPTTGGLDVEEVKSRFSSMKNNDPQASKMRLIGEEETVDLSKHKEFKVVKKPPWVKSNWYKELTPKEQESILALSAYGGKTSKRLVDGYIELCEWLDADLVLQRAPNSQFHDLIDAAENDRMLTRGERGKAGLRNLPSRLSNDQIFVIQHDWVDFVKSIPGTDGGAMDGLRHEPDGSYFADASIPDMPYERCVFEFQLSGKRCLVRMKAQTLGEPETGEGIYVRLSEGWFDMSTLDKGQHLNLMRPLLRMTTDHIVAISIMLDSEVGESEVVRSQHKLNSRREKLNKAAIRDYHVVDLSKRKRYTALPDEMQSDDEPEHGKVRLHWRRGHWRHFSKHKTWINWMLVGNPDLGFIDKEYRL